MKTPELPQVNYAQLYGMLVEAVDSAGFQVVHDADKGLMNIEPRALHVGEVQGLDALAEKLVSDWQADGRMQPHAWDYRGFAKDAMTRALAARQPVAEPVELAVWWGPMAESNGRQNWTVILYRKGDKLFKGPYIEIERSEYPDRMRYEADRLRYVIGELDEEPDIMKYDPDLHSGYVAPKAQAVDLGQLYTTEMGEAANRYHASFKFAHPLPVQWRWHELWERMCSAVIKDQTNG